MKDFNHDAVKSTEACGLDQARLARTLALLNQLYLKSENVSHFVQAVEKLMTNPDSNGEPIRIMAYISAMYFSEQTKNILHSSAYNQSLKKVIDELDESIESGKAISEFESLTGVTKEKLQEALKGVKEFLKGVEDEG